MSPGHSAEDELLATLAPNIPAPTSLIDRLSSLQNAMPSVSISFQRFFVRQHTCFPASCCEEGAFEVRDGRVACGY